MENDQYPQRSQTQRIPAQHARQQYGYQQQPQPQPQPQYDPYQQPQYQQPQYQQPQYQQPQYQQPQFQKQMVMPGKDASSTGSWFITLLLMCIPIVNLVLLFVWAFGANTEVSKKNWARANLIWIIIIIIISVGLSAYAVATGVSLDFLYRR